MSPFSGASEASAVVTGGGRGALGSRPGETSGGELGHALTRPSESCPEICDPDRWTERRRPSSSRGAARNVSARRPWAASAWNCRNRGCSRVRGGSAAPRAYVRQLAAAFVFFFPLSFNSYSYSMRGKRNYHSISSIFCVFSLCLKFFFSLVPTKTLEWHTENKNENRMRLKWKEMEEAARIRILCLLRR